METQVNLNDFVTVKLTEKGVKYYTEYIRKDIIDMDQKYPNMPYKFFVSSFNNMTNKLKIVDGEFIIEMQLHEFANIFGPVLYNGSRMIKDMNIKIRSCL